MIDERLDDIRTLLWQIAQQDPADVELSPEDETWNEELATHLDAIEQDIEIAPFLLQILEQDKQFLQALLRQDDLLRRLHTLSQGNPQALWDFLQKRTTYSLTDAKVWTYHGLRKKGYTVRQCNDAVREQFGTGLHYNQYRDYCLRVTGEEPIEG